MTGNVFVSVLTSGMDTFVKKLNGVDRHKINFDNNSNPIPVWSSRAPHIGVHEFSVTVINFKFPLQPHQSKYFITQ